MNILIEEHKDFLRELIKNGVEFLLIGGYAVNFYGYNRATGDMDLWLKPDNSNKEKLINSLVKMDFEPDDLEEIRKSDFKEYIVFSMWEPPFLPMGDVQIPVLKLNHLILSKISNGRPQDNADIEELQKVQAVRNKKK